VPGNKHWTDLVNPVDNQANSYLGKTYYVFTWSKQDAAFFYNKDAFAKAGIKGTPSTWADFIADLAALKKAGYIPAFHALGEPYPIAENGTFLSLVENQVMQASFKKMDLDHNGSIDIRELLYGIKHHIYSAMNPDYQEAWKLMQQYAQYWEPNPAGVKNPPNQLAQGWVQGKIAVYYAGQYALGYIPGAKLSFKWGLFHFPWVTRASSRYASSTRPGYGIWGSWNADSWGIPAATEKRGHLAMALDFIDWVTAPKNEIPVALENGFTPTASGYTPSDPIHKTFADILQHPIMQGPAEATLGEQFLRDRIAAMQGYITGVYSLPQAMQLMQQAIDKAAARATKITGLSIP
jgi:ABC-type glycerol-3-phosphate transport system substrate-binding protein